MTSESKFFFVIGAMKSGTTSLHEILSHHPEICMSKSKEPNFFNSNFSKGLDWYHSLFQSHDLLCGDVSPNYSRSHIWQDTASNMFGLFPKARLIYIVRDPIDRIVSHLHHDIYRDRLKPGRVDLTIKNSKDYVATSSYYFQLSQYLTHYSKESVLILPFELLKNDPQICMNRICSFLGIGQFEVSIKTKFYTSEKKYLIKKYDLAKKMLPSRFRNFYHLMFYLIGIKYDKPKLTIESLKHLKNELSSDIEKFKSFVQYDFPEWKSYDAIQ